MPGIDQGIFRNFQNESKLLLEEMQRILEASEGHLHQAKSLEDFGQRVDRIMGAAKSLAVMEKNESHQIHRVGDLSAICKAVAYKASQIKDNQALYDVCVALLLDAVEALLEMISGSEEILNSQLKQVLNQTFIDRLKWVSSQFGAEYRATVDLHKGKPTKMKQEDIDELLKKLGLD